MSTGTTPQQVVIIGAGPAGLSVGHELQLRGVEPLILERGHRPGASWSLMYENLKLGPWITSSLQESRVRWTKAYRPAPSMEYSQYLRVYADTKLLRVRTGVEVQEVIPDPSGFVVATDQGVIRTRLVVNATGYFANPYRPDIPGAKDSPIVQIHSADCRSRDSLKSKVPVPASVLVVGGNLSAGEMLLELHDAGYHVDISVRGKAAFGHSLVVQRLAAPLYFAVENARVRRQPYLLGDSRRPMDGGRSRRLIRRGEVTLQPEIARFDSNWVEFADGMTQRYELVVYATGYRPHLEHLKGILPLDSLTGLPEFNGMESRHIPGLYFLGLDNLRNFRSRFIRGIREDAALLADVLIDRLESSAELVGRDSSKDAPRLLETD